MYPEYARDSFVKSTIKNVSKLAALPKNYFKKNMVVFHKKFGRGIIKSITEIRISVMFDDCRLKVLDKQTVLQGRLLLNEKDNNATLKSKLKKTSEFKCLWDNGKSIEKSFLKVLYNWSFLGLQLIYH